MSATRSYVFTRCVDLHLIEGADDRILFEAVMTEKRSHMYPTGRVVRAARDTPRNALLAAWDLLLTDSDPEPTSAP